MLYTATYSPDDNRLRLYASSRLDAATNNRVKSAGFKWAPKQELFVAPMWTPEREDLLLELAGTIDDEDKSLVDRAEERAERFEDYSDKRAEDADRAHSAVKSIVDGIPFGQPILVGHHSERRARKDAQKIEDGMRKAIKLWDTSRYWQDRAKAALRHAKYKELPAVRHRRIKGLEADKRKQERYVSQAEMWLKLWSECGNEQDTTLQMGVALRIAGMCHLRMPRKEGDRRDFDQTPSAYDALNGTYPNLYAPRTIEEVIAAAHKLYPRSIAHHGRWLAHYTNRIAYERAMMEEAGGIPTEKTGPEKGGGCKCWASPRGGWSYIVKVNKVTVTVLDNWGNGGKNFTRTIPFDKLSAVMTKAEVDQARTDGRLIEAQDETGYGLLDSGEPSRDESGRERAERVHREAFEAKSAEDAGKALNREAVQQLRDTLKAGVQVFSAPQLFPTPPQLAARMVELAEIEPGHRILEPSAGTGAIVDAVHRANLEAGNQTDLVAVELNRDLAHRLAFNSALGGSRVHPGDFLEQNGNLGQFDRILMNPPFGNADDIKHIQHARHMLKPGGRIVAICANGPRQNEQLQPLADSWEVLPRDTFAGTNVSSVLLTISV